MKDNEQVPSASESVRTNQGNYDNTLDDREL